MTQSIRREILEQASNCVCGQRDEEYGIPEDSFNEIAKLWSYWLSVNVTAHDVGIMMALLKIARSKDRSNKR